jgi:hypothetical protein
MGKTNLHRSEDGSFDDSITLEASGTRVTLFVQSDPSKISTNPDQIDKLLILLNIYWAFQNLRDHSRSRIS